MTKGLKRITTRVIISALEKDGFYLHHQIGSHRTYKKAGTPYRVTLSYHHSSDILPPGTLRRIIKQAGWTEDDLRRLKLKK
ncbi:type II toxin-antitoxin system HicA family toxin [bacterium]|nr:type II toxin-antitoxin system HicA family toxin [bacterium]